MKLTEEKLQEMIEQYYDSIYRYCRIRVEEDQDAYDLAQEVFLALCRSYRKVECEGVRQWLYRTAYHKLADFYHEKSHSAKRLVSLEEVGDMPDPAMWFAQELVERRLSGEMLSSGQLEIYRAEALNLLSDLERRLYDGVFVKKKPYRMLAEEMGIHETALRKRVSRLVFKLHGIIKEIVKK